MGLVDYYSDSEEEEKELTSVTPAVTEKNAPLKRKLILPDPVELPASIPAAPRTPEVKKSKQTAALTALLPAPTSSITKVDPVAFRQHDELRALDKEEESEDRPTAEGSTANTKRPKNLFAIDVTPALPRLPSQSTLPLASKAVARPKEKRKVAEPTHEPVFGPLPGLEEDLPEEYTPSAASAPPAHALDDGGMKTISQASLLEMDETKRAEWLAQLPNGGELPQPHANKYSGVHRKKHNIMWLAQQAQEKRGELDAKFARIKQSKAEAASRYGFR